MEYCKKNIVAKFRELFSAQMPLGSLKVIESMFISIRILKRNKNIWQVFYLVFSLVCESAAQSLHRGIYEKIPEVCPPGGWKGAETY